MMRPKVTMKESTRTNGKNESPWTFPENPQLFGFYQWTEARRRMRKDDYRKTRQSIKSLVEKEDQPIPMAMTDIDPGYFTDLAGRAIREKFSAREYVEQAILVLRTRLLAGYERDECMKIDRQFTEERRRFNNIEKKYRRYVTAFENYLSVDHESSMEILNEADREGKKTNQLLNKRDQLSKDLGQIRLDVYQLEDMWRTAKACYDFVNKISSKARMSEGMPGETVEKPVKEVQDELLGLIDDFERDIEKLGSPEISLTDPQELIKVLNTMELRNLDAMIHLESLTAPMQEVTSKMAAAEESIENEIRQIEEHLQNLQSQIYQSIYRAKKLERYTNYLLHQVFKDLVCSESVLQLHVFIEDTYESCIGKNDANLDDYTMMRIIEKTYENLNMNLDNLPHDIVRICEKEGFAQEMRIFRDAKEAAKKFELMHRLLKALRRIMEPTVLKPREKPLPRLYLKPRRTRDSAASMKLSRKSHSPGFFIDKCLSDIDIDVSINEEKLTEKKENGVSQLIDENYDDCRDEMS